jgi:hypothetical protein
MATDIDCVDNIEEYDSEKFGGFSLLEVDRAGRADLMFEDDQVKAASDRVKKSGALELLAKWEAEDRPDYSQGGRPRIISAHAILVGLILLEQEFSSLFLRGLSVTFQTRISPAGRAMLDLPEPGRNRLDARKERQRWEKNTNNAFHRISDLIDPFPMKRHSALTYTQVGEVLAAHDEEHERVMKLRLDEFTNALLLMTYNEQPRRLRRASKKIDASIDQSSIAPPNKRGYSKKTLGHRIHQEATRTVEKLSPGPVDIFAGWYAKHDDDARLDLKPGTEDPTSPAKRGTGPALVWAWTLNTMVRVDSEPGGVKRFPKLALALSMSLPNVGVSEEAVNLMKFALKTGLQPGIIDADKQYFANATVDRLHQPTSELGFTPSTEYRVDRLGVQGGKGGAEFIEGGVYCPGTPAALKTATKDKHDGIIDVQTYLARIAERRAFELHAKERPDASGKQPLRCPALGDSPTVTCPLRELSKKAANVERPGVDQADIPEFLDRICKQHSVSFTKEDTLRQKQAFPFMSEEWDEFHDHARQSIESLHSGFKDEGKELVASSGRRRVRGFAAGQILVTVMILNFNLRTIAKFLRDEVEADAEPDRVRAVTIVRRRDRVWDNLYTKTTARDSILDIQERGELESPLRT